MKGVERQIDNSLPGILSLFDIDFTTRGLTWAGNIYQKWDNLCLDNAFVQKPCEYAGALGDHVRDILDEVAKDWLNHSDNCLEGPVSDLSLEHDVIADVCKKSRVGLDEYHGNGKLQPCVELETLVSSMEYLSSDTLCSVPLDLIQKEKASVLTSSEVARSEHLDDRGEASKDVPDQAASRINLSSALSSPDDTFLSEHHRIKGGLMLSGTPRSLEKASLLGSLQNNHESPKEPSTERASATPPESALCLTVMNSDGFDNEVLVSHDVVDLNTEPMEEYEDVKPEDCMDDIGRHEISLTLHKLQKNMSYKSKLKHAFRSKVWSFKKDHELVENLSGGNIIGVKNVAVIAASSVYRDDLGSEISSTHSYESDWELL